MDAVVQVAFSMVQAGCPTAVLQSQQHVMLEVIERRLLGEAHVGVEVAGAAEAVAADARHIERSIYRCGWGRIEVSGAAFGEIRASLPGAVGAARTGASEIGL